MDKAFDFSKLSESFLSVINKPELAFQFFEMLPIPIEVFGADGMTIYINKAGLEMTGCKDASLLVGVYNLWKDPVCNEIMGKEVIDRIFRGEAVTYLDFPAPIQDVLNRGVIKEKPWEAATMDLYLLPIWDGDKFICTICFFTVKSMYKGKADIVEAKKYIDSHWLDEFDSGAVAKALNISPAHLRELFKRHTGMTMRDYYIRVKIDRIKEKLKDKNLTVAQAFSFCGADSRGQMAKNFKEITGISPKEYRQSLK